LADGRFSAAAAARRFVIQMIGQRATAIKDIMQQIRTARVLLNL
jgi:hypothetical protein